MCTRSIDSATSYFPHPLLTVVHHPSLPLMLFIESPRNWSGRNRINKPKGRKYRRITMIYSPCVVQFTTNNCDKPPTEWVCVCDRPRDQRRRNWSVFWWLNKEIAYPIINLMAFCAWVGVQILIRWPHYLPTTRARFGAWVREGVHMWVNQWNTIIAVNIITWPNKQPKQPPPAYQNNINLWWIVMIAVGDWDRTRSRDKENVLVCAGDKRRRINWRVAAEQVT